MSWFLIYTLWQKKISFNVARGKLFLFLIFQTVLFREGYNPACDQTAVNRHAMIGQMVLGYVFRLSDLNKLSARLSIASMARSLAPIGTHINHSTYTHNGECDHNAVNGSSSLPPIIGRTIVDRGIRISSATSRISSWYRFSLATHEMRRKEISTRWRKR